MTQEVFGNTIITIGTAIFSKKQKPLHLGKVQGHFYFFLHLKMINAVCIEPMTLADKIHIKTRLY